MRHLSVSVVVLLPLAISLMPLLISFTISQQPSNQTSPAAIGQKGENSAVAVVDIDALLDAVGVPSCIENCLDSSKLRSGLAQMLKLNNSYDDFQQTCQQFHSAKLCIHSAACFTANLFDTVAAGLQSLCEGPKRQFIARNEQCLRQNLDVTSRACEQKCLLIKALADFSHRHDLQGLGIVHLLGLLENLGPVCSAANCYLPCYRDGLNSNCPKAGGIIMDGLLRPFYQLANFIHKGGIGIQKFVEDKVPNECKFLTKKEPLDKLVNPNRKN